MSAVQYQHISSDVHIPTNQEMGPTAGPLDQYPREEEFLQSISFDTEYSGNWLKNLQNMQPNGQIYQASVDYSLNNPSNMEPAGQSTEAFVDPNFNIPTQVQPVWQYPEAFGDQSYNIPTHMQLAGQPTLNSLNQSSNTYTNIQDLGQSTASLTNQSSYDPTNTHPLEQYTQAPINHGGNTAAIVPLDGQATQLTLHYIGNPQTNVSLDGQTTPAPVPSSGNPQTNAPSDGQATPARVPSSGNENKKTRTPKKSSPASTKGKLKHPAAAEDKDIERCARKYAFSYAETMILLDYANARLKGIETSEPRDAPSRYIISRYEQVRRTYPDQATWPYDLPKEKIIRLLPGQTRQDRAPIKSYHGACEKRRQELDDRYNESRQWEGPPPPKPDETQQNALIDPAIDSIATESTTPSNVESAEVAANTIVTGLTPPGTWNFNPVEVAANNTATGLTPPPHFEPAELAFDNSTTGLTPPGDWNFDSAEVASNNIATGLTPPPNLDSAELANEIVALGSWGFDTPEGTELFRQIMQDGIQSLDNSASASTFESGMEGIEGPVQLPQQPPFTAPIQPDVPDPLNYLANGPTASGVIHMAGSGEPAPSPSLLPTFTPMEQSSADLLENSNIPAAFDVTKCKNPLAPLTFAPLKQDNAGPLDNSHPPAGSDDDDFNSLFDGSKGRSSPPPTSAPAGSDGDDFNSLFDGSEGRSSPPPTSEQDTTNPLTNANPAAESADSPLGSLFEEPLELINNHEMVQQPEESAQYPSALPTFTPMEQDGMIALDNLYLPAVTDYSQLDSILDKEFQFMDDTEFNMLLQSFEGGSGDIGMEGLAMEM